MDIKLDYNDMCQLEHPERCRVAKELIIADLTAALLKYKIVDSEHDRILKDLSSWASQVLPRWQESRKDLHPNR